MYMMIPSFTRYLFQVISKLQPLPEISCQMNVGMKKLTTQEVSGIWREDRMKWSTLGRATSCWVRKTKLNITWVKWWDTYTINNRGTAASKNQLQKEKQGALYFKRLMMVDLSWTCFLTFPFLLHYVEMGWKISYFSILFSKCDDCVLYLTCSVRRCLCYRFVVTMTRTFLNF